MMLAGIDASALMSATFVVPTCTLPPAMFTVGVPVMLTLPETSTFPVTELVPCSVTGTGAEAAFTT